MSSNIALQFENYSIYVTLYLRGANPGFHYGFFVPTDTPTGRIWHATNRSGGWFLETKVSSQVPDSLSLCVAFKIGAVDSSNWALLESTLNGVPANGQRSEITGEEFSCRTWVKDALYALEKSRIIRLLVSVEDIEKELITSAEANRENVEHHANSALVKNNTGFSATS